MFSPKKEQKTSSQYVSPTLTPKAFAAAEKTLAQQGIKLSRSDSTLVVRKGINPPIVYQKEKKPLGAGNFGAVFLLIDKTGTRKKVIKQDTKANTYVKFLPGLKEELRKTEKKERCDYKTLIACRLNTLKDPKTAKNIPKNVMEYLIILISNIEKLLKERTEMLLRESSMINKVYGKSDVFLELFQISMPFLPGKTLRNKLGDGITMVEGLDLTMNIIKTYRVLNLLLGIAMIDIKSDNIIIDEKGRVLPCDFGFAQKFGTHYQFQNLSPESQLQIAPELKKGATIDYRIDVYPLGFLIGEISHATKKTEINKKDDFLHSLQDIYLTRMRQPDPKNRTITLKEVNKRLLSLRAKHFPDAAVFIPNLHSIFKEKIIISKKKEIEQRSTRRL
jgi:serine/threonine protein kinase